ncbi:MAG: hypothetical protein ACI4IK_02060 [Eubacterium sp.]
MAKKKNKEEEFNFDFIKEYIESRVVATGLSRFVESKVVNKDDEKALKVKFDCDGYSVYINCEELVSTLNLEYEFTYSGSSTRFLLTDIFNVLDINDFYDYYYSASADNEEEQKRTVDDLLYTIKRFDYDIRKAGEKKYLDDMQSMHYADKQINDSDDLKIKDIIRCARLQTKMQKTKSEKDKQAFLKEMKSREERHLLTTYDKRYVAYLEQGYPIPDNADSEDGDYFGYLKTVTVSTLICVAAGMAVCFALMLADKAMISNKGLYIFDNSNYIFAILGGCMLGYVLYSILATKIAVAIAPEEQRDYVKKERKERFKDDNFLAKLWKKYISVILAALFSVVMMLVVSSGVCFNDNAVIHHFSVFDQEVNYEDARIYLVKGWYDSDDVYSEYESPCYRIEYGEENTVETGEINSKDTLKELERIFNEHGITPVEVKE